MTTDRDRERAAWVLLGIPDAEDRVAYMVEQLAAERERVLAPVLAALDALSRETGAYEAGYKSWAQTVIREVRRAAQDGESE